MRQVDSSDKKNESCCCTSACLKRFEYKGVPDASIVLCCPFKWFLKVPGVWNRQVFVCMS